MQGSLVSLEKRAVKAGVATDWKLAKELNLEILKLEPANYDAKNRLGKALLELKEYTKASKCFKEVLENDPLNHAAQKNLVLAKERRTTKPNGSAKTNIILEPGTYAETSFEITAKRYTATSFSKGQEFGLKPDHTHVKVLYERSDKTVVELGELDNVRVKSKIVATKKAKVALKATYLRGEEKTGIILIVADSPIFEAERQDVKPYMKRDFIEDSSENAEVVIED